MQTTLTLITAILVLRGFPPLAHAQCPQTCDPFGDTALGNYALAGHGGNDNTAIGFIALYSDTTGIANTGTGNAVLASNTTGSDNTATGYQALFSNTTGADNTASGVNALELNTTGNFNSANGWYALQANTTGYQNTASGAQALYSNTTGIWNTASGYNALNGNTTGNFNTADGLQALYSNTSGGSNTACGLYALYGNTTGSNNIALGDLAGGNLTTGSNNIDVGNAGVAAESRVIRIGSSGTQTATFIAGIRGVAIAGAQPVGVDASGQLGVRASAARFKENIKPMDKASEAILSLQPVTFRYKKELDPEGVPQFGLVAEEVAKVAPDLVMCDDRGKPFTVRYDEVNAMLLNEFLKEHQTVKLQQKEIEALRAELKEQRALIQQVNDKIEFSKSAQQIVSNQP